MGDASGKGAAGALLMTNTLGVLQDESEPDGTARHYITRVNERLHATQARDQFVTVFYAVLSPHSRKLTYVNAGHPRALLVCPSGFQTLAATGPPIGVFPDTQYDQGSITAEAGDTLVVYSDGVTEAQSSGGEYFGEAGLRALLERCLDYPAPRLARAVCEEAERFERDNPDGGDDKVVVVARITDSV